jgi:rRNA maturation endonuclease Nob1
MSEVVIMDINSLIPYDKNPRKNKEAVEFVKNSIKEFGFKVPIVVDKDNIIITGHTRLLASKELGIKKVPVIVANDLTEEQVKAYRLVDNKTSEFASWDYELLDLELEDIEINMEMFGFVEPTIDWKNVEEITKKNYEKPDSEKLRCPICGEVDEKIRFVSVSNDKGE